MNGIMLGDTHELSTQASMAQGLFHPLPIALLACRMGVPVNASYTAQAYQWRRPGQSNRETEPMNFYMEGGCNGILSHHRMTLVWEEIEDKTKGMSDHHHAFSDESQEARLLKTATLSESCATSAPSTILYDCKDATIMYQCLEQDVVRHSIGMVFYCHSISDDALELLSDSAEIELPNIELGELLLGCFFPHYDQYFRKLFFGTEALRAIVDKLSSVNVDTPAESCPLSEQESLVKRALAYKRDNQAAITGDIVCLENDIRIVGGYNDEIYFFNALILKARRDVHLPFGADLVQQNAVEENRECARQYIRDMSGDMVEQRLENYVPNSDQRVVQSQRSDVDHQCPGFGLTDRTRRSANPWLWLCR